MNKSELVDAVAERAGTDRAVARRHVDAVFDAIIDTVTAGDRVLVTGFGTFDRFARPARTARNPRTGQSVEVAAADVPRFRVGQTFKNRVAGGAVQAQAPAEAAAPAAAEETAPAEVAKAKKPKKGKKEAAAKAPGKKAGGKGDGKGDGKKKAAAGKKAGKKSAKRA